MAKSLGWAPILTPLILLLFVTPVAYFLGVWKFGGQTYWACLGLYGTAIVVAIWLAPAIRRNWKESLMLAATITLLVTIAEVVLPKSAPRLALQRYSGILSEEYHHRLPSGVTMWIDAFWGEAAIVSTNEDGYRTSYSRADFVKKEVRIAVMGDSFVFGLGVARGEPWPRKLERLLRDRFAGRDVGVLNAGIISASPIMAVPLYDGIVRHYEPQIVFYMLDATDIGDDLKYGKTIRMDGERMYFDLSEFRPTVMDIGPYHGALHQIARPYSDYLLDVLRYPYDVARVLLFDAKMELKPLIAYAEFSLTINGVNETDRFFIYRHSIEYTRPYLEDTLGYVTKLAERVEASGATFVFIVTPRYQHWNPNEAPEDGEARLHSPDDPYRYEYLEFFDRAAGRVDFPVLNLLPAFQATSRFPLVLHNDPHWNADGHMFVAERMAEYIEDHDLIGADFDSSP